MSCEVGDCEVCAGLPDDLVSQRRDFGADIVMRWLAIAGSTSDGLNERLEPQFVVFSSNAIVIVVLEGAH